MLVWLHEQSDGYPAAGGAHAYQSWRVSGLGGVSLHLPRACLLPSVYWLYFLQINFLCLSLCICPEILCLRSVQFLRCSALSPDSASKCPAPKCPGESKSSQLGLEGRGPCSGSGGSFQSLTGFRVS